MLLLLIMTVLHVADILTPDVPGSVINCVSACTTEVEARVEYTVLRGLDAIFFDALAIILVIGQLDAQNLVLY